MRGLLVLLASALLLGCQPAADGSRARQVADQAIEYERPTLISRKPISPYPGATSVRLFVQNARDAEGRGLFVEPEGRLLIRAEREAIEATIAVASYKGGANLKAACFIPHHFLKYYDAAGQELGGFDICFCCQQISGGDASVNDALPPGADYSELEFDASALRAVIHGMGLRTDFECEPGEA